jgi:integrase/recombinase XerD
MLNQAVDDYLAVRRAAGFKLKTTEQYLRYFVRFADARGETYLRASSAIDWAA